MKSFDNSHDTLADAAKEILEGNTSKSEELDEAIDFSQVPDKNLISWVKKFRTVKGNPWSDFKQDMAAAEREVKLRKLKVEAIEESAEVTISVDNVALTEALRAGRGKTTIDADYIGDRYFTNVSQRQFKIKIKPTGKSTADITGEKKNIIAFLQSDDYGMDDRDIKDLFPELLESLTEAKIEVPTDEKAIKQFLDKAKMMRATEKDFDQSMKPLPLKQFAMVDKIARDHKDFNYAYQTGYDAGMGYDLPKGGGLEGNNPHKKNTFAYWLWMDIAGQGMADA